MSLPTGNNRNFDSDTLHLLTAVIDGMKVPAYVVDFHAQELLFLNKAFMEAYGNRYDYEQKRWNVMWPGMNKECPVSGLDKLVDGSGSPTGVVNSHDYFDSNDQRWYLLTEALIEWVDGRSAILLTRDDVTEQREYERKLTERAYVDQLTGAYNQQYITDGMGRLSGEVQSCGVMAMDVRSFKNINESFGHDFGDKVLVSIVRTLRNLVPFTPLARVSSNEFVFVFENIDIEAMKAVGEGVLICFHEPFCVENQEMYIDFRIGIAHSDVGELDIPALFRDADIALYYAKKGPHNLYVLTDELRDAFNSRVNMEYELRHAIERGEFELYYQPKVQVRDKTVHGAEALIRWNHPERGVVSPGYFIPLAEETGLILQIGEFVIAEAARQLRVWRDAGIDVFVSVNASVRQFLSVDFHSTLQRWLNEYSLPHELLIVEVTESIVAGDINRVINILENLRKDGIRVSLDDFGTGYSSLNYIVKMPLDNLKIDKSFIDNVLINEKDEVVLETIITMAHNLGLTVIAEGVEQKEQVTLLEEMECDLIQGYYFAKPLRAEQFAQFYHENLRDAHAHQEYRGDVRRTFFMRVDKTGFDFIDNMPFACSVWSSSGELLYSNREFLGHFGADIPVESVARYHMLSPERQPDGRSSDEAAQVHVSRTVETGSDEFYWIHLNAEGGQEPARIMLRKIPYGESYVIVAYLRFESECREYFDEMRLEEERLLTIIENMPVACHYRDKSMRVKDCNLALLDMLGLKTKPEYIDKSDGFRPERQPDGEKSEEKIQKHVERARERGASRFGWMLQDINGAPVPCEVTMVYARQNDDEILISYFKDLREARRNLQALNHLEYLANTDALTGARNRRSFEKASETMFESSDSLFLFMIDLDLFKKVNDTYGHQAGDEVLRQLTRNIRTLLRKTDVFSRYGGEEFTVLAQGLNRDTAISLAERIRNVLEKTPVVLDNIKIYQTVSIGIAERTSEIEDMETLVRNADKALYEAKRTGRNKAVFYDG